MYIARIHSSVNIREYTMKPTTDLTSSISGSIALVLLILIVFLLYLVNSVSLLLLGPPHFRYVSSSFRLLMVLLSIVSAFYATDDCAV